MKKTYESPWLEQIAISSNPFMQAASGSGVYGDGEASDITYGGTDDEGNDPQAKHTNLWYEYTTVQRNFTIRSADHHRSHSEDVWV